MTKIELLDYLKSEARSFRADRDSFERNKHMHNADCTPSQEEVDAVLVGFINQIGLSQGVDYGLYAVDLSAEAEEKP
jgi:hypothetical protein